MTLRALSSCVVESSSGLPLYGTNATRDLEQQLLQQTQPHALMDLAGRSVCRLARALAPHARHIWIACGPGNNGGDGLVAAALLQTDAARLGLRVTVTWCSSTRPRSADAQYALTKALNAGVHLSEHPPEACDLAIDALLGLGAQQKTKQTPARDPDALATRISTLRAHLRQAPLLLCVDLPSGLCADTGTDTLEQDIAPMRTSVTPNGQAKTNQSNTGAPHRSRYSTIANYSMNTCLRQVFTLTFLTLKPGLFTAQGRDEAGSIWLDDLGLDSKALNIQRPSPDAWLGRSDRPAAHRLLRLHSSHKGRFGDVWIVGGQGISSHGQGMTGAAVLAARAALHAGAGRVFVVPLGEPVVAWDPDQPELMFRTPSSAFTGDFHLAGSWVCGCGGGDMVAAHLPRLLADPAPLVIDADGLNALAAKPEWLLLAAERWGRAWITVLTPHPLEAARLLGWTTHAVQSNRLLAARDLAAKYQAICVLKGSGTVVSAPGAVPWINNTGNARLATAGTGDVLAGMVGAALAQPTVHPCTTPALLMEEAMRDVCSVVAEHGRIADTWQASSALTASTLAAAIRR